jgi:phosphatidylglycerophosphatase A
VTVLLWFGVAQEIPAGSETAFAIAWVVVTTLLGIPAATREAQSCGAKDPSHVVIDEMAGQMLTLIAAPVRWKTLLMGFILFRCFDILKPPPLRALERLPDGIGIMLDDLGAGLYALLVLAVVLKLWPAL